MRGGMSGANMPQSANPMLQMVLSMIQQNGGLGGLLQQFEQAGHGQAAQSWVRPGAPNAPINADVLQQVLGSGALSSIAGGVLGRVLGGGNAAPTITPEQASQVSPADAAVIAEHAEKKDPSILDRAGEFYAQHPQLVKGLGAAALAIVLGRMRSQS